MAEIPDKEFEVPLKPKFIKFQDIIDYILNRYTLLIKLRFYGSVVDRWAEEFGYDLKTDKGVCLRNQILIALQRINEGAPDISRPI